MLLKADSSSSSLAPFLTLGQVAERLACSTDQITRLILEGKLTAIDLALHPGKTRACYRIPPLSLDHYIKSSTYQG